MPKRSFKSYTIASGGTPQPLIGTTTTAAILKVASTPVGSPTLNIAVTDSSMFRPTDHVMLDVGSSAERVRVTAVPDSTHITVTGPTLNHLSGIYVALKVPFTALYVQTLPGNTGVMVFFYPDQQFSPAQVAPNKTGLIKAFMQLEPVGSTTQPFELSTSNVFGSNPDSTEFYWVDGTTGDGYLPSFDFT